ncbi:MAG: hypothetical protein DMD41_11105 [Gemmatimonadetes bacterium]|nr:MAG: hypothetical protein DMD41_11105 [Gemmatimonadota bacterium]
MRRGDVLEVMRFVQDQPAVGRQHGRLEPVVGGEAHGEVGGEQVVIHHDDVGLGGAAARLEDEAALKVRAGEPRAQVRLGGDRVPHVGRGLVGEIGETAVGGAPGPGGDRLKLGRAVGLE